MSTDPWATPADLAARWRPLAPGEAERARVLIEDAQSLIQDECPRWAVASAATRRRIVCAVVKRAMAGPLADEGLTGVTATTETTGPFSQQVTFSNPSGDMYLTRAEKRALGTGRPRAHEVDLLAGRGGSP